MKMTMTAKKKFKTIICLLLVIVMLVPMLAACGSDGDIIFATFDFWAYIFFGQSNNPDTPYLGVGHVPTGYNIRNDGQTIVSSGEAVQSVAVQGDNADVTLSGTDCGTVSVYGGYTGTKLTVGDSTDGTASSVGLFQAQSPVVVDNTPGSIKNADIWPGAEGTTFTNMPDMLVLKPGTWVIVDGVRYDNTDGTTDMVLPQEQEEATDTTTTTPATTPAASTEPAASSGPSAAPSNAPALSLSPLAISSAKRNVPYSQAFTASGGTAPYTYTISGSIAEGLSFSGNTLSGTPTLYNIGGVTKNTYNFTITATDAKGQTVQQAYSFRVQDSVEITSSSPLPGGFKDAGYRHWLTTYCVNHGINSSEHKVSITSGELPSGLSLDKNGNFSGVPTSVGTYTFTAAATCNLGIHSIPKTFSITIADSQAPAINNGAATDTINLTKGYSAYSKAYAITGNPTPGVGMDFTANANTAGASIEQDGTLTIPAGLPAGSYTANFIARNEVHFASMAVTVNVTSGAPDINNGAATDTISLTEGYAAYNKTYTISGDPTPDVDMDFTANTAGASISGGTLTIPAGLAPGSYTANFTATNTEGTASMAVGVNVAAAPAIEITTTSLPAWTQGAAYSRQIATSGGLGAKIFTLESGALPAGVTLSSGGLLSGTPSASGTYNFTVKVVDSAHTPTSDTQSYTVVINTPLDVSFEQSFPSGVVGAAFDSGVYAGWNGTAPYTLSLSGTLPQGLSFSPATGRITGTPAAGTAGNWPVTVNVTDSGGATASLPVTVQIASSFMGFAQSGNAPLVAASEQMPEPAGQAHAPTEEVPKEPEPGGNTPPPAEGTTPAPSEGGADAEPVQGTGSTDATPAPEAESPTPAPPESGADAEPVQATGSTEEPPAPTTANTEEEPPALETVKEESAVQLLLSVLASPWDYLFPLLFAV